MQSSCKWTFYFCSSFCYCSCSPSFLLLLFFRLFALCLKNDSSTAPSRHSVVVLCVMLLTQVSLERSNNTTQPKQDPRVCLSVLSTRNEIEKPATDTREGGGKKKRNKNKNETKERKSSTQQIQKKQLQRSNALSFFLSFFRDFLLLSPPPTPPQSSSHSALMDGLTYKI